MQREGGRGRVTRGVEDLLVHHQLGSAVALLARLEHEHDVPGDLIAVLGEQAGGTDEHRHVGVVPARMHRAVVLGNEGQACLFEDRKGVHVRA